MNNKKDKIKKYITLYRRRGVLLVILSSLIFGTIFSPHMIFGDMIFFCSSFVMSIGLCIGMAMGQAKDEQLSENIMIIRKIETTKDTTDIVIYVRDKNEIEKQYRITDKKMKKEKMVEGDRVAEKEDGSLVSLETKKII